MTGAVNRDLWRCGSFADFVAGATHGEEPRSVAFVASTALCEPAFSFSLTLTLTRSFTHLLRALVTVLSDGVLFRLLQTCETLALNRFCDI